MENLYIESTEYTPKINLDIKNQKFEIKGSSRPENVISFYGSVMYKVENYVNGILLKNFENKNKSFNIKIDLIYINSASSKYILHILDFFKKLNHKNIKLKVDWFYEDVDDQILEDGEDLSDVLNIPFNFISRQ